MRKIIYQAVIFFALLSWIALKAQDSLVYFELQSIQNGNKDLLELTELAKIKKPYLTLEKIGSIGFAASAGVCSGLADYNMHKKYVSFGSESVNYDTKYHTYQWAERAFLVGSGICIGLDGKNVLQSISGGLFAGAVFSFTHNVSINLSNGLGPFEQSDYQKQNNTSITDKYLGGFCGQIGMVAVCFLIDYLVYLIMR